MNKSGNNLRRLPWRRSIAASVALAISGAAIAQSNSVGTIFGTSSDGGKITITNTATGAVRTATVDAAGRFQVPSLPVGTYKVELTKADNTVESKESVPVAVGSGSQVIFGDEVLDEAMVAATGSIIDVSSTDTRTVFTAEDLGKVSVKQSIEEIALLAPGTVRGDSRYNSNRGNPSASFGGSGANENAFYINGYAVTDPIKGLGSSSLPFDSISQYQLLTGGYGAEFGRSTGGVVNIVTKSGSNNWVAGGQVTYTPSGLMEDSPDIYYPANGTSRDNTLWNQTSKRNTTSTLYSLYAGGPIIEDKLFVFLNGEFEKRKVEGPANFAGRGTAATDGPNGWHDRDIEVPRWMAKVDYNFAEGQLLELTAISDVRKETRKQYGYYYPGGTAVPTATTNPDRGLAQLTKGTNQNGGFDYEDGGELYIAKYTGTITENLIFTALYGQQKNKHSIVPYGYDDTITAVRDNRSSGAPLFYGSYATLSDPDAYDKSNGYRFDLEWIAGAHDFRIGYDVQDLQVQDGTITTGPGYFWQYDTVGVANANLPIDGAGGAVGPGGNGDYVTRSVSSNGGVFTTDQYAYFIEDRWQVSNTVLVSLGLRNENFKNYNSDKVVFLDQTNQWAPRIGVSWDVMGNSRLRAFANAGRYHLAIPLNLAFRQVGGSLNTDEYFRYTGIDPTTSAPTGLVPLGSGPYSPNQEYGQARDPLAAAAQNLKPYFQDELTFGLEGTVYEGLRAGARFTYRTLKSQLDDNCDGRPAYNWAVANGRGSGVDADDLLGGSGGPNGLDDLAEEYWTQLAQCRIINPGEANIIRFTDPVTGEAVLANITAEQWGLPKLKRIYKGVDIFLERPMQNGWYGKIDYTLSKSTGNAEGMLYSDSGQADVAVTANWDSPELMVGSDGVLPNDRRHQIKALGFYEFSPEWRVSATVVSMSGRPRSPIGFYGGEGVLPVATIPGGVPPAELTPTYIHDNFVAYNGPYYHYVDGELAKRGSLGRLPWTTTLDLGVRYSPNFAKNQLQFGVDVFNVFDTQEVQSRMEDAESALGVPYHSYQKILSYNAPRTFRFTVRYDWKAN
jgi:hypothetical protein